MQFICDAPGQKSWFRIETENEAIFEAEAMKVSIDAPFRIERDAAVQSYRPQARLRAIERDIGLGAHVLRTMPIYLTLRDREGTALANAVLPAKDDLQEDHHAVVIGPGHADPFASQAEAIHALELHYGVSLQTKRFAVEEEDVLIWPTCQILP